MAKKKSNPQSENNNNNNNNNKSIDDAASEKLDSLKSLNAMLLKETVERRQQVDSLTSMNESLESELKLCKSDNASLQFDMNLLNERAVKLEIEKGLASKVYADQVSEMKEKIGGLERDVSRVLEVKNEKESEIGRLNDRLSLLEGEISEERFILSKVCEERDEIRAQIDERIRCENELRLKLTEAEKRETVSLEKSRKIKGDYDELVKGKKDIERKLEAVVGEKGLIEKRLSVSNGLVEKLRMDIDEIAKENVNIEDERKLQVKKKNELQKLVDELKGLVDKLQKAEEQLLKEVADLEKNSVVSSEKEAKMRAEFDILVKEKEEIEGSMRRLTEEKSLVTKDLNDALKNLRQQNLTIDQLVKEKIKINDAKSQGENDIVKLQEQLEEFKNTIATLEKSSTVQVGKIHQLESEVSRCKAALDQSTKERNNAQANLDGEKLKGNNLSEKISEMEKGVEEMSKKLTKMQKNAEKAVAEKKELEKARSGLENEILVIKKSLAKTQKDLDDTKGKLRLSEANTSQILKLLKNTSLICNSKEDGKMGKGQEIEFGQDIKNHVKEVEAIKKAFKDKESAVDEMKKEVELLKVCVAKADKGKSFWTMVSSVTTVLAAVSLACVARAGN